MPVKTGTFNKPASTGSQAITGVGFQPTALILFCTGNTADGTWVDPIRYAVGFAATNGDYSCAAGMDDNVSPTQAQARAAAKAITIIDGNGTLLGEADITAFDSDGFTLDWTTANATQFLIGFMAIGGEGVTSHVTEWQVTATGNKAITGVGFTPQVVFFLSAGLIAAAPSTAARAQQSIGAMDDSGNQWSYNFRSDDNEGSVDCLKDTQDDRVVRHSEATFGNPSLNVLYVSMDADGYTVNVSSKTKNYYIYSLALAGLDNVLVGNFTKAIAVGTQAVTVNFEANGIFNVGSGPALVSAKTVTIYSSIGAVGAVGEDVVGLICEPDGSNPSQEKAVLETGKSFSKARNVTETIDAEADLDSYSATQFTIDWTTNDGIAVPNYFYVAMAAPAAAAEEGDDPIFFFF